MTIQLYHNDCINKMDCMLESGIRVDAIITDPPYELENHGGTKSKMAQRVAKIRDEVDFMSNGFNYNEVFDRFMKLCKIPNFVIFCSNNQISKIMSWFENKGLSTTLLIWNKTNPSPLCNGKYISDIEYIVYVRGKGSPWNHLNPTSIKYKIKKYPFVSPKIKTHPTQKPIELMEEFIKLHTFNNQTILDPFIGSGTTGIACINTERNFIGIENNEKYFNIAKKRIEDSNKQLKLF